MGCTRHLSYFYEKKIQKYAGNELFENNVKNKSFLDLMVCLQIDGLFSLKTQKSN